MWRFICPELLKAIDTEPESEVLMVMLDSLARCIQKLGPSYIDQESMAEILRIIDKLMKEHFERESDRHKKHLDEDYDEVCLFIHACELFKLIVYFRRYRNNWKMKSPTTYMCCAK